MKVTDQAGFEVEIPENADRIISTVPSQTELLFDLGLEDKIAGITRWCVHPADRVKNYPIIGGTKDLDIKKIKELRPDLIIGNKEENIKEQINELKDIAPVWLSDVITFNDAVEMIAETGKITNCRERALDLTEEIKQAEKELMQKTENRKLKTLYFIWKEPLMVAGRDTFIHEMMLKAGLETAVHSIDDRYPEVSEEDIVKAEPDVVLLSSEPYPFSAADLHKMGELLPNSSIYIVDGQWFSWYGSRMIKALEYFNNFAARVQN